MEGEGDSQSYWNALSGYSGYWAEGIGGLRRLTRSAGEDEGGHQEECAQP